MTTVEPLVPEGSHIRLGQGSARHREQSRAVIIFLFSATGSLAFVPCIASLLVASTPLPHGQASESVAARQSGRS